MKNQSQRLGLHMWQGLVFSIALLMGVGAHAQTAIESIASVAARCG